MPQPKCKQFKLAEEDRTRLSALIREQKTADSTDLEARGRAYARWYRLWRAGVEPASHPDEEGSNFHIPLIQWQILNSQAKEMMALFGEGTDIQVIPRGKTDINRVNKVKRWMDYRVQNLDLLRRYYDFGLLKRIYGTSIAFLRWVIKKRTVIDLVPETVTENVEQKDPATGLTALVPVPREVVREVEKEVTDFEGLMLDAENIEDWIVPKSATTLEDADHFSRHLKLTVEEILDLRDQGKIDEQLWKDDKELNDKLEHLAKTGKPDTSASGTPGQPVKEEKAAQTGLPTAPSGSEDRIPIYNWFGRMRLKEGKKKSERPEQLVAFWSEDLQLLLGVCRLVDIYPDGRLPFVKSVCVRDPKSFWGAGYSEVLESIGDEMDSLHNITTDGGLASIGPIVIFKPSSGYNPQKQRLEPWMALPCEDPNGVKVVTMGNANMAPYVALMPQLLAMSERIFGNTETQMGRQFSGPNAPRTYGQQALLQAESNSRIFMDLQMERETFRDVLQRVWEADKRWLPKPYFFRVTEEDPGDTLTEEDMIGDYDFDIGPTTQMLNKAQATQELLQAYALGMQNPLVQQNPALQAAALKKVYEKLGHPDFAALVPSPQQLVPPQSPEVENARLIQGEDVDPHPADNHIEHIAKHTFWRDRIQGAEGIFPGVGSYIGMGANTVANFNSHIAEHERALKTQGANINMMGRGAPTGLQGQVSGPIPQMPGLPQPATAPTNPAGAPGQNALAGMLNRGGVNLG